MTQKGSLMSDDCLFCKIINKTIPADIVYEDEHVTAFKDINPQAPTHVLVIPNTHVSQFSEVKEAEHFAKIFPSVQQVAQHLNLTDYRIAINNGAGAGQTVFHLHVHILSGRTFQWPPG